MARIRSIKPQFWLSEDLGTVPRDARLLYIGLWNLSDDRGVFEWKPARIKIQIFPYDNDITTEIVENWLDNLVKIHNIINFTEDGEEYGYIPKFSKHQDIKHPSKWTFTHTIPLLQEATPALGESSPTPTPALPLGSREKEKLEVIGSREKRAPHLQEDKNVFIAYEKYAKQPLTPVISEELKDVEQEYGVEIVLAAFQKASSNGKSGGYFLKYCQPILEEYKLKGIPENRKNGGNYGRNQINNKQLENSDELAVANARFAAAHPKRNLSLHDLQ